MSASQIKTQLARASKVLTKTATATLTRSEMLANSIIVGTHASVAIALTLPAASGTYKGRSWVVAQGGAAAVTVVCAAGFGGGSTATDVITLAQGMGTLIFCDGTAWFAVNATVAA